MRTTKLACAVLLLSGLCAHATTIAFSGTGQQSSVYLSFQMTGDGFQYHLRSSEGPYAIAFCYVPGARCDFHWSTFAGTLPEVDHLGASVEFQGVSTGSVVGNLGFAGSLVPPVAKVPFDQTVPVTMSAELTAYSPPADGHGYTLLFSLHVEGHGTAVIGGWHTDEGIFVRRATYTFEGTAEAVPEPAAGLLAASALAALYISRRRRKCRLSW